MTLFTSLNFAVFIVAVGTTYHFVGDKWKWAVLLGASVVFYAAIHLPHLLGIALYVLLVSYFWGIAIGRTHEIRARRVLLLSGIVLNLLPLIFLRYFLSFAGFLGSSNASPWVSLITKIVSGGASIGVSFYSFQAISYLVDVYWRIIPPERNLGNFALYLIFFPKMLQGPIERAEHLLPQLKNLGTLQYDNLRYGLVLFTWGAFKKVVVADRLAQSVNLVYGNVHGYSALPMLAATLGYAIQLYADFSGYTDMALGIARLFGVKLTDNFSTPYFANSFPDFWRRWHITLSQWLLHYVFMPLQKSTIRLRTFSAPLAILSTFAICGLWHGARWTFLLWGFYNGICLAASLLTRNLRRRIIKLTRLDKTPRIHKSLQIIFTFTLVCAGWVCFRAESVGEAVYLLETMGRAFGNPAAFITELEQVSFGKLYELGVVLAVPGILVLTTIDVYSYQGKKLEQVLAKPWMLRWPIYYALLLSLLFLGVWGSSDFLYFQF